MKKGTLLALTCAVTLFSCQSLGVPTITTHTDDFTGTSYRELRIQGDDPPFLVTLYYNIRFRVGSSTVVIFEMTSEEWHFIDTATVRIDGEFHRFEAYDYNRTVPSQYYVQEWVVFRVPKSVLHEIAGADDVRFRFSGQRMIDYTMTDRAQEYLNIFLYGENRNENPDRDDSGNPYHDSRLRPPHEPDH